MTLQNKIYNLTVSSKYNWTGYVSCLEKIIYALRKKTKQKKLNLKNWKVQ